MKNLLTSLCLLFVVAQASAQITCPQNSELVPFNCDDDLFYQLSSKTKIYTYDADNGEYEYEFNVISTNAIGYNTLDNFIYGIKRSTNELVKIGACGSVNLGAVTNLTDISGLPSNGSGYFVGDFDNQGNLYVTTSNLQKAFSINIATNVATEINVGATIRASDFSFDATSGAFFFFNKDTDHLNSWNPNLTTGNMITSYGAPLSSPSCSAYGATFLDEDRVLYSYCNATGALHGVDLDTLTGYTVFVADASTNLVNSQNDGASCSAGILGSYCCAGENLVQNPGFSLGNTGFTSDYTYDSNTSNGFNAYQYAIADSTDAKGICDNWNIVEEADCNEAGAFLLVNGLTSQASNTNNAVWSQTFTNLEIGESYKFCAKFKHLANSCHDIAPRIRVSSGSYTSAWETINTNGTDECDWDLYDTSFSPSSSTQVVSIELEHTVYNDGNDLAIDDLGFFKGCGSESSSRTANTGANLLENAPDKTKDIYQMSIQPNPGTDYVIARFDNVDEAGMLSLIDINGKLILSMDKRQGQVNQKISLDKLPVGLYILRLDFGGEFISEKIIKH